MNEKQSILAYQVHHGLVERLMWYRVVVEIDMKDILGERYEQVEFPRLEKSLCQSQNDSMSITGSIECS